MGSKIETYKNSVLLSVHDTRPLEDVIAEKCKQVNSYRTQILNSSIFFQGIQWDSDAHSQARLTSVITGLSAGVVLPSPFYWRDYNNVNQLVDNTMLTNLHAALILWNNSVYSASWNHKNAIKSLINNIDIDNYNYKINWPSNQIDSIVIN